MGMCLQVSEKGENFFYYWCILISQNALCFTDSVSKHTDTANFERSEMMQLTLWRIMKIILISLLISNQNRKYQRCRCALYKVVDNLWHSCTDILDNEQRAVNSNGSIR